MFARLMVGFSAVALGAGVLLAAEFAGKVKSVDAEKKSIVVTVGEKDVTFDASGAEIVSKKSGKALKNGLASVKAGAEVVVHADAEGGKATKIEVSFKKKAAN
jgi:hypothetical protein